ncbi:MAG TPA: hypothetical protein VFA44_02665 [Gaiellaceae bacterium]|nr:hypothetical protein [Gaiellaceae bacterium]
MEATAVAGVPARALALLRLRPRVAAALALAGGWAGVSAWLAVDFSGRIRDWAVMTDELLYTKLAISVADTGSPLPRVHDTLVGVLDQLYPLLLAPFFAAFDVPAAFHAAHVFNAPLMASACIPAYLLARQVVPRLPALAVAFLSVTVPWMVLTGVLMTEPAAYPAFLWAVLGCVRALRAPSLRTDALAAGGLVLAVLARTQFVVLAIVLPLAALAGALADTTAGSPQRRLVEAAAAVVRRHRLLAACYLTAAAGAGAVSATRSLGDALGVYGTTLHGSILPPSVWGAAAAHLDAVAIGCGLVPLVLGGGWLLAVAAGPRRHREHLPFAAFSLVTVAALAVETASFDVRFGGERIVRDRYLFYAVPLLLTAAAAAVGGARSRGTAVGAAAVTALFAATVHLLDLPTSTAFWVDSPERILNGPLADGAGSLGTHAFVALAGAVLGLALVLGLLALPGRLLGLAALAFLLPFTVLTTRDEIGTVARGNGSSGRPVTGPPGVVLDWVDSVLPRGAGAAMIPFPQSPQFPLDALRWWDVEFWNRTVGQTFVGRDGNFSYAPFPNRTLAPDWRSGRVAGTGHAPPFVVFALDDARFRLAGVRHADNLGLEVLLAERPYRAAWATQGLDGDGWARPGRPATIRVYPPQARASEVRVRVTLAAPPDAPARYELRSAAGRRRGVIAAGAVTTEGVTLCVAPGAPADLALAASSTARIPGMPLSFDASPPRRVGARVGPIETADTGSGCRP